MGESYNKLYFKFEIKKRMQNLNETKRKDKSGQTKLYDMLKGKKGDCNGKTTAGTLLGKTTVATG